MNLRDGPHSVREILQNPQARGLIQREVPQLAGMLNSPMAVAWQGMTLNAVAAQAQRFMPAGRVQYLIQCLQNL